MLSSYAASANGAMTDSSTTSSTTVAGATDEPLYRLYDSIDKQHFWTDSYTSTTRCARLRGTGMMKALWAMSSPARWRAPRLRRSIA